MITKRAFTLVELLLSMAIIAIVGAASFSVGGSFLVRNHLRNKTQELVASLYSAQINAQEGKNDSQWGVYVSSQEIILFSGDSYLSRNTAFDESFHVPGSITSSGGEVLFSQFWGEPSGTLSFTLTSNAGDTKTISINQLGSINVN